MPLPFKYYFLKHLEAFLALYFQAFANTVLTDEEMVNINPSLFKISAEKLADVKLSLSFYPDRGVPDNYRAFYDKLSYAAEQADPQTMQIPLLAVLILLKRAITADSFTPIPKQPKTAKLASAMAALSITDPANISVFTELKKIQGSMDLEKEEALTTLCRLELFVGEKGTYECVTALSNDLTSNTRAALSFRMTVIGYISRWLTKNKEDLLRDTRDSEMSIRCEEIRLISNAVTVGIKDVHFPKKYSSLLKLISNLGEVIENCITRSNQQEHCFLLLEKCINDLETTELISGPDKPSQSKRPTLE